MQDSLHRVYDDVFYVVGIRFVIFKLVLGVESIPHVVDHASNDEPVKVLVLTLVVNDKQEEGSELGLLAD